MEYRRRKEGNHYIIKYKRWWHGWKAIKNELEDMDLIGFTWGYSDKWFTEEESLSLCSLKKNTVWIRGLHTELNLLALNNFTVIESDIQNRDYIELTYKLNA